MSDEFRDMLETFENQYPGREYTIEIVCPDERGSVTHAQRAVIPSNVKNLTIPHRMIAHSSA